MEWSWAAWLVSVAAVVASGALAWHEGNWRKRPGLGMGFADHGGMWSDLILLPIANAAIVPHLTVGWWLPAAVAIATVASIAVHRHWYQPGPTRGDHLWCQQPHSGAWARDLSRAGWAHVVYVVGELTLLIGFLLHPAPLETVVLVTAVFTIHVPIGLLQPRYFLTGRIATVGEQPLLAPLLLALWAMASVKVV